MQLLTVNALTCGYGNRAVLKDLSFSLESGTLRCLLGPNGAGKSTLLKTLSGQLPPISGSVFFSSAENKKTDLYRCTHPCRARQVAFVPQEYAQNPFSVLDSVVMGRAACLGRRSSPEKHDYDIAREVLESLRMSSLANLRFDRLSGGQKRLVLTARALASQSPVIVLDEPDSGLDIANKKLLYQALKICAAAGKAVLFSSHDPDCARQLGAASLLAGNGHVEVCRTLTAKKLSAVYGTSFAEAIVQGFENGRVVFVPVL